MAVEEKLQVSRQDAPFSGVTGCGGVVAFLACVRTPPGVICGEAVPMLPLLLRPPSAPAGPGLPLARGGEEATRSGPRPPVEP